MFLTIIAAVGLILGAGLLASRLAARPQAVRVPVRIHRSRSRRF